MDNTANHFLNCAQCIFYKVATSLCSCSKREILGMASYNIFEPPSDFGCNMAIRKDAGEPMDAPVDTEFLTCDNCKHFEDKDFFDDETGDKMFSAVVCCNSSVFGLTPLDAFKPTPNFGCNRFESKYPPAVPVKMDFD